MGLCRVEETIESVRGSDWIVEVADGGVGGVVGRKNVKSEITVVYGQSRLL